MSFNADHLLAARGISYAGLIPGNPDHEAEAEAIIRQVMPEDLGEAYDRLVHLARQMQGSDGPVDDCLHCWIGGTGSGPTRFDPYTGKRGFMASDAEAPHPLLLSMRRIAMFDVPRRLFAEDHGIWVYWLFNGVFVLSPTEQVDLDWAFRRHAFRLEWGLTGTMPKAERTNDDARAYVYQHLSLNAAEGLERIRDGLTREHPLGIDNIPVQGPLFEPASAWFGSLTGTELLRQELGLGERLITYNCGGCGAPAIPLDPSQKPKPSSVLQLQNQSPDRRDC